MNNVIETIPAEHAFVHPSRRGNHIRPRYAFVRNPNRELHNDSYNLCWALYDIVDNSEGHERVMAYHVRFNEATEIVSALNAVEEAKRVASLP